MKHLFFCLVVLIFSLNADIRSTSGQIKFDVQGDQQADLILNTTGLGVGITPSSNLDVNGNVIISTQLFSGGRTGSSNTNLNGSFGFGVQTITTDQTLEHQSIILADTSSDNITLSLPTASSASGRVYEIKRIVDNLNYVHITSSDNIDDENNYYDLVEYQSIKLVSNGTQWFNLTSTSSNDAIVASDNLVFWCKFQKSSGSAAFESTGLDRHGELVDNASISDDEEILNLDGTNDSIDFNSFNGITGTNPRSISLWMKRSGGVDMAMVSWGENVAGQKYTFRTQDDNGTANTIRIEVNGGYAVGSTNVLDNNWHHVAVTWENDGTPNVNDHKLYVDGVQETLSTSATESMNTATTQHVRISNDHNNRNFNGSLDDARIYDKALSANEIKSIYDRGRR